MQARSAAESSFNSGVPQTPFFGSTEFVVMAFLLIDLLSTVGTSLRVKVRRREIDLPCNRKRGEGHLPGAGAAAGSVPADDLSQLVDGELIEFRRFAGAFPCRNQVPFHGFLPFARRFRPNA